jgi:hypothetical protein
MKYKKLYEFIPLFIYLFVYLFINSLFNDDVNSSNHVAMVKKEERKYHSGEMI